MTAYPGGIRTPDQRLRVFVSSTLKELATERAAARAAIERLRLAPVMFELGARPHPPRELYRAYLHQSDIFLGIYGERYGWVAPGEAVSGLEDEYNLATSLPKLIYIRESETTRDPRLSELLDRLRNDDRASFKYFSTVQELRRLIEGDVATLLAERFDQSRPIPADSSSSVPKTDSLTIPATSVPVPTPAAPTPPATSIPVPLTDLIGRERELDSLDRLLSRDAVRLVTLLGPGGIGKSRLALATAARITAGASADVAFADLTAVQDATLVPNVIAQSIGVLDTGDLPILQKLTTALRDRDLVIIVDNFEHVVGAAPTLTRLLSAAPGVKFLVTSRTLLRVSGEYAFDVGPLGLPDPSRLRAATAMASSSVALFVARARAVKPDFELTDENVGAIGRICRALDGVPLAIELAAARTRMLTPAAMLTRLDRQLPLLSGGARDLPLRQQTLRSTIEWSTQLLDDDEKELLALVGVFAGGFSLEAVESVLAPVQGGSAGAGPETDTISALGALVDNSLVRERDRGGRSFFSMLATVREYALEQLEASGKLATTRARHAAYFLELGDRIEAELEGGNQRDVVLMLNDDRDNFRAAARFLLDGHQWDEVAHLSWRLLIYWWVAGLLGEVRGWMREVLAADEPLDDRTRAIALFFINSVTLWQDADGDKGALRGLRECAELFRHVDDKPAEALTRISLALAILGNRESDPAQADEALETSLQLFRAAGDRWGEAMALVTLGRIALMRKESKTAVLRFEESLQLARRRHDDLGTAIALDHLGWAQLVRGHPNDAQESFEESLQTSARLGHAEGIGQGLEGLIAIAAQQHRVERAGRLLRARDAVRRQAGLADATNFSFHQHYLAPILKGADAADLEKARLEGPELTVEETVAYALERQG